MSKKEKESSKDAQKFIRKYYWSVFFKHKRYSPAILLSYPVNIIFTSIEPLLIANIFDGLADGSISNKQELMGPVLMLMIVGLTAILLMLIRDLYRARFMVRSYNFVLNDTMKKIFSMGEKFFSNRMSGSLLSDAQRFSQSQQNYINTIFGGVIAAIVTVGITGSILYSRSPLLLLCILPALFIYSFVPVLIRRKRMGLARKESRLFSSLSGSANDSLTNYSSVIATGNESQEVLYVSKSVEAWSLASIKRRVFVDSSFKINRILDLFTFIAITIVSAGLYLDGRVGIGTIVLVQAYVGTILASLRSIPEQIVALDDVYSSAYTMAEIMMMEPEIKDPQNPVQLTIQKGEIEFQKASFKYTNSSEEFKDQDKQEVPKRNKEEQHLFRDLNLAIKPGEKIGLVGPSGGGKSTLLKLILRFYDVYSGEVKIDGVNVKEVIQSKLRQQIAYVPQDPALFHRSIGENIGYSKPKAKQSEIQQAAKQAYVDEFIQTLPDGYDTLVGERGVKLSGGQRQRVAIARAILKDAPILLLDEATSALDSESESYIQKSLEKLMKNRTTVVVAHRLSTIRKMDRIVVIDKGRVVDSGPHDQLLKTSALYKKLWSHQSGGVLLD